MSGEDRAGCSVQRASHDETMKTYANTAKTAKRAKILPSFCIFFVGSSILLDFFAKYIMKLLTQPRVLSSNKRPRSKCPPGGASLLYVGGLDHIRAGTEQYEHSSKTGEVSRRTLTGQSCNYMTTLLYLSLLTSTFTQCHIICLKLN